MANQAGITWAAEATVSTSSVRETRITRPKKVRSGTDNDVESEPFRVKQKAQSKNKDERNSHNS